MDSNRWQRIKQAYQRIVELPPNQWQQALSSLDPELIEEVTKLLWPDEAALNLLKPAQFAYIPETESALPVGTEIGGFTVTGELGSGGMGRVYRGVRQQQPADLQVAIKVLKKGVFAAGLTAEFKKESDILSYLNHPHIARCYGAGFWNEDQPYFVMEYVEGVPIDRYCGERRLDLRARLTLCQQVCSAITYAHQNLVIHRDIKPANILVTSQGQVKLMDFGIAKVLDAKPVQGNSREDQLLAFTPGYASPEQRSGGTTTTASDVYSLGVLLSELLTGVKPPGPAPRPGGCTDPLWLMRLEDRPSRWVLSQVSGPARQSFFAEIGLPAERLSAKLRGDLDWIMLRATAKEPADRYPSSERLGADLRRYLHKFPLQGREQQRLYAGRKFVQRHWLAVTAGLVGLLVAVAFTILLSIQNRRIQVQWERAERNLTRAQVVSDFLVDLFGQADPFQAKGQPPNAKELLDRGLEKMEERQIEDPVTRAAILHTMASAYEVLSLRTTAQGLFEQAYELRRETLGENHPETAKSLMGLAAIYLFNGNIERGEEALNRALDIHLVHHEIDDIRVAQTLSGFASLYAKKLDFERSEDYYKRTLAIIDANPKTWIRALRGNVLNGYARMKRVQGERIHAEQLFRAAIADKRDHLKAGHPGIANVLNDFAVFLRQMDRLEEAETYLLESYALTHGAFGEANDKTLTVANNLAANLGAQGRAEEAEAIYRDSLAALLLRAEPEIGLIVTIANNLSKSLMDRGEVVEAQGWLQLGRDHLDDLPHPSPVLDLILMANQAELYGRQGLFELADPLFDQALARARKLFGDHHPAIAKVQYKRAFALANVACHDQAFTAYAQAFAIREAKLGPTHHETVLCLRGWVDLAAARSNLSQLDNLQAIWERLLPIYQDSKPSKQAVIEEISARLAQN